MHRFIPAYAAQVGAKIVEVPVNHHPRRYGQSKYGLGRTMKVVQDLCTVKLLTKYATKPGYLLGGAGLVFLLSGILAFLAMLIGGMVLKHPQVIWPLFLLAVVLTGFGIQAVLLGLVAELLMRTYYEAQVNARM